MLRSPAALASQQRRLDIIKRRIQATGADLPDAGITAALATRYVLARGASASTSMAAYDAACKGLPHSTSLAYLWCRGLVLALSR